VPHLNDGLVFLARQREGVEHLGEALLEKVERLVEGQHLLLDDLCCDELSVGVSVGGRHDVIVEIL
jgi:hypothetical protein